MSNGWTLERRLRQSQLIQQWQPWKSAGVKTPEGKAISRRNSYKHGARSAEVRAMARQLTEWKRALNQLVEFIYGGLKPRVLKRKTPDSSPI